eukprot:RCo013490
MDALVGGLWAASLGASAEGLEVANGLPEWGATECHFRTHDFVYIRKAPAQDSSQAVSAAGEELSDVALCALRCVTVLGEPTAVQELLQAMGPQASSSSSWRATLASVQDRDV